MGVLPELPKWQLWFADLPSVLPSDVTNDAAFFYILLAVCICQNFIITVCDRGVQITKAFPVTQEQLNNDHPRLEVKVCCKELTLLIDHDLNLNGVLVKIWKSSAAETLKNLTVTNDSCYLQLDNFSVCNIQGISCSTNYTENFETAISAYLGQNWEAFKGYCSLCLFPSGHWNKEVPKQRKAMKRKREVYDISGLSERRISAVIKLFTEISEELSIYINFKSLSSSKGTVILNLFIFRRTDSLHCF